MFSLLLKDLISDFYLYWRKCCTEEGSFNLNRIVILPSDNHSLAISIRSYLPLNAEIISNRLTIEKYVVLGLAILIVFIKLLSYFQKQDIHKVSDESQPCLEHILL